MTNRYQAFAEWRIGTHRSSNRGHSVRFFCKTRDYTVIWTLVMRDYHAQELDLAKNTEDRQLMEVIFGPAATGYPSFMGPNVPQDKVEAS